MHKEKEETAQEETVQKENGPEETAQKENIPEENIPEESAPEKDAPEDNASEETGGEEPQAEEAQAGESGEQEEKTTGKERLDALIEDLNDRIKRQMAEFENFRKRSEKEKSSMFEMGARSVIEQILPIVDNFERGLAAVSEEAKADPFVEGMDKVYRQMAEMLEKLGVKPIEAVGCTFNPDLHNAVMHTDDEESPENTVVEEFLKGYTYKDHVVRHSMVKVAN